METGMAGSGYRRDLFDRLGIRKADWTAFAVCLGVGALGTYLYWRGPKR